MSTNLNSPYPAERFLMEDLREIPKGSQQIILDELKKMGLHNQFDASFLRDAHTDRMLSFLKDAGSLDKMTWEGFVSSLSLSTAPSSEITDKLIAEHKEILKILLRTTQRIENIMAEREALMSH